MEVNGPHPRADTSLHEGPHGGLLGPSPPVSPTSRCGRGASPPEDSSMRKTLLFIVLLTLTAAWLIGCSSSKKKIVPPQTQTTTFAFMQGVGTGTGTFSPMVGTYTTTNGTTTFTAAAVLDKSTNQPIEATFFSIFLSADGKTATLDLYGGLDGTSGQWDIWVAPADGSSNPTQVTNDTNDNGMPQLSPDGTRVAFNSYRLDESENYVTMVVTRKIDGTGEQVLAPPPGAEWTWAPTYSPDGSKIAVEGYGFDSTNQVYYDGIWVMNAADGSSPTMLTNPYANCDCYDENPAYTPDGSKIVFSRNTYYSDTGTEIEDIYIMNADGTGVTQLTNNGVGDFDPMVITVAGTLQILFSSNFTNPSDTTGDSFELYSMNMDGTNMTQLTTNSLYDAFSAEWYGVDAAAARIATRHSQRPHHMHAGQHNPGHKVRW